MVKKSRSRRKSREQGKHRAIPVKNPSKAKPVVSQGGDSGIQSTKQYILFWGLFFVLLVPSILHGSKSTIMVEHIFLKDTFISTSIALIVLMWAIATLFFPSKIRIPYSFFGGVMLLLLLYGAASIFWSENSGHLIQKLFIWLGGAFGFAIAYLESDSLKKINYLLAAIAVAGFVTAFIGAGQFIFNLDIVAQAAKPASTFGNRNMATHMVVLAIPASLYLLFYKERAKNELWIDLVLALSVFTMYLYIYQTGTRSAWLACIVEIIVLLPIVGMLHFRKQLYFPLNRTKSIAILVSFLLVLPFAFLIYQPDEEGSGGKTIIYNPKERVTRNMDKTLGQLAEDKKYVRLINWSASYKTFLEKPIAGWGLGNWKHAYRASGHLPEGANSAARAHNDIIQLSVELGLIGIFILVVAGIVLLYRSGRFLLVSNRTEQLTVVAFAIPAVLGTVAQAQFSFPYQISVPTLALGVYLGIICSINQREFGHRQTLSVDARYRYPVLLFAALFSVFALYANNYWNTVINKINQNVATRSWEPLPLEEYKWLENNYFYAMINHAALNRNLFPPTATAKFNKFSIAAFSDLQDSVFVEFISLQQLALHYLGLGDIDKALYYYSLAVWKNALGSNSMIRSLVYIFTNYPEKRPELKIFMQESIMPIVRSERKESKVFYQDSESLLRYLGDESASKEVLNRRKELYPENGE